MAKRKKKTIKFMYEDRQICNKCGHPEGFCIHTIEDQYKERCSAIKSDNKDVWWLIRQLAIAETEKNNIWESLYNENKVLIAENKALNIENESLRNFKNHMRDIIVVKGV